MWRAVLTGMLLLFVAVGLAGTAAVAYLSDNAQNPGNTFATGNWITAYLQPDQGYDDTETATWPFTTGSNYTYNSAKIEVAGGYAQLVAPYPSDAPTIQPVTGEAYDKLLAFTHTLGPANQGAVRYQISNDGTNWYYHNGSSWGNATGFAQTNTATEVNDNIGRFDNDVGAGTFYFKAFLSSDGAQQVQLDEVRIIKRYDLTSAELGYVASSDDTSYTELAGWPASYGDEKVRFTFPDIPSGVTVTGVTITVEWAWLSSLTDPGAAAKLKVKRAGGETQSYNLTPPSVGYTDTTETLDVSAFVQTVDHVNYLTLSFRAEFTSGPSEGIKTRHDLVEVKVIYK